MRVYSLVFFLCWIGILMLLVVLLWALVFAIKDMLLVVQPDYSR